MIPNVEILDNDNSIVPPSNERMQCLNFLDVREKDGRKSFDVIIDVLAVDYTDIEIKNACAKELYVIKPELLPPGYLKLLSGKNRVLDLKYLNAFIKTVQRLPTHANPIVEINPYSPFDTLLKSSHKSNILGEYVLDNAVGILEAIEMVETNIVITGKDQVARVCLLLGSIKEMSSDNQAMQYLLEQPNCSINLAAKALNNYSTTKTFLNPDGPFKIVVNQTLNPVISHLRNLVLNLKDLLSYASSSKFDIIDKNSMRYSHIESFCHKFARPYKTATETKFGEFAQAFYACDSDGFPTVISPDNSGLVFKAVEPGLTADSEYGKKSELADPGDGLGFTKLDLPIASNHTPIADDGVLS